MMQWAPIVFAGVAAAIVWFIIGGALYMNPFVARIYEREAECSPAVRKWESTVRMLVGQFAGVLIQCLLWAMVFVWIKPALPAGLFRAGLAFGVILIALKIIPRLIDMWLVSTYPPRLLLLEAGNGSIGSFVIALTLAAFLR